ncbi:MAG: hypothetical protein IM535_07590 [Pseudanabaena sp. M38BS1SP1A06MG]|nr:hypothetical protein [Pseudanabaena sp. M38BS1SP1A06MG]
MISLKKAILGTSIACAVLIATTSCASTTAAQNIVTNGEFENGTTGFTVTGGFTGISPGAGVGGSGGAFFGAVGSTGTISQNLTTVVGSIYTLSYALQSPGTTPSSFAVAVNGTTLSSFNNPPAFGYTTFTNTFTASSSSSLLSFIGRNDPDFFYLDSVSVTETFGLRSLSSLQASSSNRPEYQQYQRDDFSETSLNGRILAFRRDLEEN